MNVPDGLVNYAPVRIFAPGKWRCTRDGLWAIVDSAGAFVVQCRYNACGKPLITCTTEHPFYVHGKGWVAAQKLRVGNKIELQDGEDAYVDAVKYEKLAVPIQVYNFEVDEFHTYFVGGTCVLVHNMCKTGVGGKGWEGDRVWRENVKTVQKGGTITSLKGGVPTREQGIKLINAAKGTITRIEGAHLPPNPHTYPHINYVTRGIRSTLGITGLR